MLQEYAKWSITELELGFPSQDDQESLHIIADAEIPLTSLLDGESSPFPYKLKFFKTLAMGTFPSQLTLTSQNCLL